MCERLGGNLICRTNKVCGYESFKTPVGVVCCRHGPHRPVDRSARSVLQPRRLRDAHADRGKLPPESLACRPPNAPILHHRVLDAHDALDALQQPSERLGIPPSVLEWYLQQRDIQYRDDRDTDQLQPGELRQFKQWLDTQLARLPVAPEPEEPNKALVPQQPKRGNCKYGAARVRRDDVRQTQKQHTSPDASAHPSHRRSVVADMALCHFKICNMGRKRSPRTQPQDLP